jgi:hypothetical protein
VLRLENNPDSKPNLAAVEAAVAQVLKTDPALEEELRRLLVRTAQTSTVQNSSVVGEGNQTATVSGTDNTVTFGSAKRK